MSFYAIDCDQWIAAEDAAENPNFTIPQCREKEMLDLLPFMMAYTPPKDRWNAQTGSINAPT